MKQKGYEKRQFGVGKALWWS